MDEKEKREYARRALAGKKAKGPEKPKQAIALSYDPSEEAPRVIASGKPVHRDDKLADTLSRLEIGDMIPPELYEVVAEILVFVDGMEKIRAKLNR